MDRLKADFIASLPMQPDWLRLFIYFERCDRRTSGLVPVGQTVKCYHIRAKREARRAALPEVRKMEKKFLRAERSG
jgi:hypothetical protein